MRRGRVFDVAKKLKFFNKSFWATTRARRSLAEVAVEVEWTSRSQISSINQCTDKVIIMAWSAPHSLPSLWPDPPRQFQTSETHLSFLKRNTINSTLKRQTSKQIYTNDCNQFKIKKGLENHTDLILVINVWLFEHLINK